MDRQLRSKLEICVDSVKSAIAAADGGADAVELCSSGVIHFFYCTFPNSNSSVLLQLRPGLLEGGITPSLALIESVIAKVGHRLFVNVLIRCRAGDFLYSDEEISVMLRDIELCRQAGAHGVVVGALLPCGSIDTVTLQRFCSAAGLLKVTFHRAFDLANDASSALEVLIQCGVTRLLTSGQQANAIQGIPCLQALVEQSRGRIQIAAGGGINAENVASLSTSSLHNFI
jgi:copper homeostasis protein